MRRTIHSKLRPICNGISYFVIKCGLALLFLYTIFYVLRYGYTTTSNLSVGPRSLSGLPLSSNWHCELNKRMLKELQKEINERNKLLNYRGKVIAKLRGKLQDLNETNEKLKRTLVNLTEVVALKREQKMYITRPNNLNHTFVNESNFPENIKEKVDRVSRPCCIALKRMTDILRIYMETTQDLKDQVAAFQKWNFTERMYEFAEREKRKFAALNCSEQFRLETENSTKKPEKHALYQTYSAGYFYEIMPLNRATPKQKFKSRGYHRNVDFSKAVNLGLQEILKETQLPRALFEMNNALVRYDELRGAEYHLLFVFNRTRKFSVNVMKPYGPQILSDRISEFTLKHHELINVIIPISKMNKRFNQFLENIKVIVQKHHENIYLTVVIYGPDEHNEIKNRIKEFTKTNNFRNYDVMKKNLPFNRGRALHDGINRWNGYSNVLMFLCDMDIKFNNGFLDRCRQNTKLGKTVYMPVVYSLYNPNIAFNGRENFTESEQYNITEHTGTWRPLGYGMLCVYKPDYMKSHGFNLKINGWGGEDVNLYHRFLKRGINVIRAPDPDLFHVWHPKLCSPSLSKRQYQTCVGSKARYEGSQRQLGILLISKQNQSQTGNKNQSKTGN